jgi:hypothetical protein
VFTREGKRGQGELPIGSNAEGSAGIPRRLAASTKDPADERAPAHTSDHSAATPSTSIYTSNLALRRPTRCSREPLNPPASTESISRSRNVFHRGECKPIRAIASAPAGHARNRNVTSCSLQGECPSDCSRFRSSAGALSPSVSSTASHTRLLSPPGTRSRPQSTTTSARRSSSTRQRLPGHRRTRLRARAVDVSATFIHCQEWWKDGHAECFVRWFEFDGRTQMLWNMNGSPAV